MGFTDMQMSDEEMDQEIENLISADVSGNAGAMEDDLEKKLASLNGKLQGAKE